MLDGPNICQFSEFLEPEFWLEAQGWEAGEVLSDHAPGKYSARCFSIYGLIGSNAPR